MHHKHELPLKTFDLIYKRGVKGRKEASSAINLVWDYTVTFVINE